MVVSNGVAWLHQAHFLPYNSYADIPRRGIATANIQQIFDMTKDYGKNLKIFADLGDFLGRVVLSR